MTARLDVSHPPLTKIIATVGPASSSPDVVRKLIEAGVSVFRLNFSHGEPDAHAARVKAIREAAATLGRPTAILGDLQGPKIRVGRVVDPGVEVQVGQTVIFQREPIEADGRSNPVRFSSGYARLIDDVEPGQRLLINDGAVRMLIVAKRPNEIECSVTAGGGGVISSGKGINLPDSSVSVDALSDRDWSYVEWSLRHDLDFLALSFVRCAEDVQQLAEGIERARVKLNAPECRPSIIAKIELPKAVHNIESILQVADGMMVARGDLGVEIDLARVPVIQKRLIATAEAYGKPCIVATQMLETMINSPMPTRAEVSDVANAIFDGADAVMLSGETAVGKYPVVAVEHMRRIAEFTEAHLATLPPRHSAPQKLIESRYRTAALAHGVWTIAQDIAAKFIVVWSQQGGGARYLSQNFFSIPIIAVTSDDRAARRMQLLRGVTPVRMPRPEGLAHFTQLVDHYLLETGWASVGDQCVLVAGSPIGEAGVTNSLALHCIGDPRTGFAAS